MLLPALPTLLFTSVCILRMLIQVSASHEQTHNRRVLFITNAESGQLNVHLATSLGMLEHHADVEIHFASFSPAAPRVEEVSRVGTTRSPKSQSIIFHAISGPSYKDTFLARGITIDDTINSPGLSGQSKLLGNLDIWLVPWTGQEYIALYRRLVQIIQEVDPEVIAVDTLFSPGMDATRNLNRKHVILSANALADNFAAMQPNGAIFWRHPALSSAYPYPVPWHLIPANIIATVRLIYTVFTTPNLRKTKAYIKNNGLENPIDLFHAYREEVPWLSPSLVESDYPMVLPPNVNACGPIFLSLAPVSEKDPELMSWLERAPTVQINLGSHTNYNESDAIEMVGAIKILFDNTKAQVLWKFNKRNEYSDDFLAPLSEELASGRLRLEKWINAEPASLLESGRVVLAVHHGGSNSFHEAIWTGIPQIVLPIWADLYDFAVRAEWLGVGIWGSRKTAPYWTADELGQAFLKALGDSEAGVSMRRKAAELGALAQKVPGRVVAARKMVEFMDSQTHTTSKPTHSEL